MKLNDLLKVLFDHEHIIIRLIKTGEQAGCETIYEGYKPYYIGRDRPIINMASQPRGACTSSLVIYVIND